MRLVHIADLHLGYRQYQRSTPTGINQREADVANAFRRAVDRVIALAPDVVLLAGDIFHNVRPTNPAILHGFTQFARLTRELPRAIVIMVAGNHDTPRASETGCILRLFSPIGIHVVEGQPRRLSFPERDLSVLAVPDVRELPALAADPAARHNLLLLHGEVAGVVPRHAATMDRAAAEIDPRLLAAGQWSYVALGHYHVCREVLPNAWYSGSLEYTSPNAWGELQEERAASLPGKGFIERDLETGSHRFHHVAGDRRLIDLRSFSAAGMSAEELNAAVRSAVEACDGGIEDCIARLVVRDLPRHIARELDARLLRELKRSALHFHLDTRRPEIIRSKGEGAPGRRPTLREMVREKLAGRPLESDLDREELVRLGLGYLQQAETTEHEAAAAATSEG